ncbi:methyltransferase domain-containing protein [Pseudonocardiaceae bacterium YIM PH 21723]|nr:methyltransferase domain-containing protein [Pseudonocardiaceae bacterium YIM PH 21723]
MTEPAVNRLRALLDPMPASMDTSHGYLDLLEARHEVPDTITQRLMRSSVVPVIYERAWRPLLGRLAKGLTGPSMAGERQYVRGQLRLKPGHTVLDLACGPGNFTRDLAGAVRPGGLVVGVDASPTMLARAIADTLDHPEVGYLRGDAERLPFADASFDAVCCFAALHMFGDPWAALDHMIRVLRPGGRIALLVSHRPESGLGAAIGSAIGTASGQRMFGQNEIHDALAQRGLTDIRQYITGFAQFLSASKA